MANFLRPGPSGLPPYVWIKPGSGGFIYQDAGFLGPKYGALAFGDGKPPENLLRSERVAPADDDLRNMLHTLTKGSRRPIRPNRSKPWTSYTTRPAS